VAEYRFSSLISVEEVCACGSSIKVIDADALGLLAVEFWAERHKGHGRVRQSSPPTAEEASRG
jgi:hypothetical protein